MLFALPDAHTLQWNALLATMASSSLKTYVHVYEIGLVKKRGEGKDGGPGVSCMAAQCALLYMKPYVMMLVHNLCQLLCNIC